jgi:hypothetical protein
MSSSHTIGNAKVSIDYVSSFHYGHLCVFTVITEGESTVYAYYADSSVIKQLTFSELPEYLLEKRRSAAIIKVFTEQKK